MTDRKQEVIDLLWEFLHSAFDCGIGRKPHCSEDKAKELYDRIAPLIRGEFPEEEIRGIPDPYVIGKDAVIAELKAIWQAPVEQSCPTCGGGTGHICHDGKFRKWPGLACSNCNSQGIDPCPDCTEKEAKVCQTCAGNKKVPDYDVAPSSGTPPYKDCPDCKGTVECQHKGCLKCGHQSNFHKPDFTQCEHRYVNERSGEERRVVKAHIVGIIETDALKKGTNSKIFLSGLDNGGLAETWKTDRRTLTDRRKAASGESQATHSARSGA